MESGQKSAKTDKHLHQSFEIEFEIFLIVPLKFTLSSVHFLIAPAKINLFVSGECRTSRSQEFCLNHSKRFITDDGVQQFTQSLTSAAILLMNYKQLQILIYLP